MIHIDENLSVPEQLAEFALCLRTLWVPPVISPAMKDIWQILFIYLDELDEDLWDISGQTKGLVRRQLDAQHYRIQIPGTFGDVWIRVSRIHQEILRSPVTNHDLVWLRQALAIAATKLEEVALLAERDSYELP